MSWESLVNSRKDNNSQDTSEIDRIFASVFSDPDGKKILEFFDITINNITLNPNAEDRVLWHLEGQRFMLQQIKLRIKRGKEWQKKK
jgi:hypothetical protein|tara:strand:+ start:2302 stop:2562 length:261 start_codon:yes stop_codon:yes gene_type:complete